MSDLKYSHICDISPESFGEKKFLYSEEYKVAPIVCINKKGVRALEVALNVPHKKGGEICFRDLFWNPEVDMQVQDYGAVLNLIERISSEDSSLSSFQFSHPNSYKFQISDPRFIDYIRNDISIFKNENIIRMLNEEGETVSEDMLVKIAENPFLYQVLLSTRNGDINTFHSTTRSVLSNMWYNYEVAMERYNSLEDRRNKLNVAISDVTDLEDGSDYDLKQAKRLLQKSLKEDSKRPLKPKLYDEDLTKIFLDFQLNPFEFCSPRYFFPAQKGCLSEMKTKLVKFNKEYSKDIVSFVLKENLEGFRARKKMLRG